MAEGAEPGYEIHVDVERRLVRLTLVGFWTRQTYERYDHALEKLAAQASAAGRSRYEYRVLVDVRRHGLQSKEVAAEIERGLTELADHGQRHAVLVSPSALHKAQARRITSRLVAGYFGDEEEALAWLLTDDAVPPASVERN